MSTAEELKRKEDPTHKDSAQDAYIKELLNENRQLRKQIGTDEGLFEYLKDSINSFKPFEKISYSKPKNKSSELAASIFVTDQHSEEIIDPDEMEGFSEYNWDIFLNRMKITASKTIQLVNLMRSGHYIRDIYLNFLGDWFLGKIRPEEESYGVCMPMPVVVPNVGQACASFVSLLAPHFDNVYINAMVGNHGRESKAVVSKMAADRNWDMAVYLIARGYTEQHKNVHWNIPKSLVHVTKIMGHNCLLTHGGHIKMNNRTPYYPIESAFDKEHKMRNSSDKDFKYAFTGHWHHRAIIADDIHLCPSMIGANQYSKNSLHVNTIPGQLLTFFHEENGLIVEWPIKL